MVSPCIIKRHLPIIYSNFSMIAFVPSNIIGTSSKLVCQVVTVPKMEYALIETSA